MDPSLPLMLNTFDWNIEFGGGCIFNISGLKFSPIKGGTDFFSPDAALEASRLLANRGGNLHCLWL